MPNVGIASPAVVVGRLGIFKKKLKSYPNIGMSGIVLSPRKRHTSDRSLLLSESRLAPNPTFKDYGRVGACKIPHGDVLPAEVCNGRRK